MSFKNALLGALVGAVVGGPAGALVGGFAGYQSENISNMIGDDTDNRDDLESIENIFSLLAKAAKTDGKINKEEIKEVYSILEMICDNLDKNETVRITERAKISFNNAAKDEFHAIRYINNLKHEPDVDIRVMIFAMVGNVCAADGPINEAEISFLKLLKKELSISDEIYLEIVGINAGNDRQREQREYTNGSDGRDRHDQTRNPGKESMNIDDAYKILGCERNSPIAEVRFKYRKKINECHPDKIQGKGLPPEFIVFANEQARKINEAYEIIKRHLA